MFTHLIRNHMFKQFILLLSSNLLPAQNTYTVRVVIVTVGRNGHRDPSSNHG